MLLSIHIPKTAGTAWRIYLERNLSETVSFVSPEARDAEEVAERALALIDQGQAEAAREMVEASPSRLIAGHRARDFLEAWPDVAAIAWLRDPFERLVSEYLHFKTRPQPMDIAQQVASGAMDIEAFASGHDRYYSEIDARLKARPAPYCFFIDTYRDKALDACTRFAGWQGGLPRRNVTPRNEYDELGDREALRHRLAPYLESEWAVYEHWRSAWADDSALEAAKAALAHAPPRKAPGLARRLRRKLGIAKESLGHMLGRDWR